MTELTGQIARILLRGKTTGEFPIADPHVTAQALFYATARFHDPVHSAEWSDPSIDQAFENVWSLLTAGLIAPRA